MEFVKWVLSVSNPKTELPFIVRMATFVVMVVAVNTVMMWLLHPPGEYDYFWGSIALGIVGVVVSVAKGREFDENYTLRQEMERLAKTDELTGLSNRRDFLHQMSDMSKRGETGMLLFVDVDHFKRINDTFGHTFGDETLCRVATHLRNCLRDGDVIGRIGGEEFAVFLKSAKASDVKAFAQRMVNTNIVVGEGKNTWEVTTSIGASAFISGSNLDQAMTDADQALYSAKSNGRARVEFAKLVAA